MQPLSIALVMAYCIMKFLIILSYRNQKMLTEWVKKCLVFFSTLTYILQFQSFGIGVRVKALTTFIAVTVGYALYLSWLLFKNGYPAGFTEFGALGDAFGTLNSLFSGLGFAGVVVTLFYQQKQIKAQEKENIQQDLRYQYDQYENTLHKYLDLYKQVLSEVSVSYEGIDATGRDWLNMNVKRVLEALKADTTTFYPKQIRDRITSGLATEQDSEIIRFIHHEHHRLIKSNISMQGRFIQTAHLLFRHLEEKSPKNYDINSARELVMSQFTHIECQYFFFICLSDKKYSDMALNMSKSIFFLKHKKFNMSDVDREFFEYAYDIKLDKEITKEKNFFDVSDVKRFRKRRKFIRATYRAMINSESGIK